MSQHRKRTTEEPSRWWVAAYATAAGIALGLVARLIGAPTWTEAHVIGVVFGIFTAAVFLGWLGHTITRIGEARIARTREAFEEDEELIRQDRERAAATGTWRGDAVGQVLTVRWDQASRTYHIQGWISDHWQQREERPWFDLETLAATLAELEATDELRPMDDEGTRMVRSRLDLPGWDSYGTAEPVREPGEDTRVIRWTDAGLPRRDVGETLRPIDTAVFRTPSD